MDIEYAYYDDEDDDDVEGEDEGGVADAYDEDNNNNMESVAASKVNRQLFEDYNGDDYGYAFDDSFSSRIKEIFDVCIVPSLIQIVGYIVTVLFCCLAFRVCSSHLRRRYARHKHLIGMLHIGSLCCGLCSLYSTMGRLTLIVISICLFNYSLLQCLRNYCHMRRNIGLIFTVITIGVPLIYEFFLRTPDSWQRIRGVQMVANMKIISLAFDDREEAKKAAANLKTKDKNNVEENYVRLPNLIAYLGYIFCPAVCALGPWLPYTAYLQSLQATGTPSKTVTTRTWLWLPHTLFNVLMAIIFLIASNCLTPFLNTTIYKLISMNMPALWLHYYVDAFGVRTSHYFICFMGQACLTLAGVRLHVDADTKTTHPLFGQLITKPWRIEFPRSLSSLVRYWNIPSHNFLKKYIYNATLQYWGGNYLAATVFTYFVSSLLHGMHAGIYLVLLSLAAFAHVEVLLRTRFADMLDCCIESNPCYKQRTGTRCTRSCCPNRLSFNDRRAWLARLINFAFSALVVFHLAYLGILLTEGENSDFKFMLLKWKRVDFLNHYIAVAAFIFYLFIS